MLDKWSITCADILLALFTVYIFFLYFDIFFVRKKKNICVRVGIITLLLWQLIIPNIIHRFPIGYNIGITVLLTLFIVTNIYDGKGWLKCFFGISFDAIWMLVETLVGAVLIIYSANIVELQPVGSLISKVIFFIVITALKKVFSNEKIKELPRAHNLLIVLIPIGSIFIMDIVFRMAYRAHWEYAQFYSIFSVVILLFINVLIFYVYIKLAEDLQVRRMNMVFQQQLDLCERHQKEMEISMQQIRDVRHSMKNHFLSILAYAERGDCEKIIGFVNEIIEDGKLKVSKMAYTGNIVTDSLVGYWQRIAENEGIEFKAKLYIPTEIPFRGADICLILGNLLENAVEAARKAEKKKYIELNIKYDKENLLLVISNSYKGKLIKGKEGELRTTKEDVFNHGIGLSSVRRTVEKYNGTVYIEDTIPECFIIRIVLYGA